MMDIADDKERYMISYPQYTCEKHGDIGNGFTITCTLGEESKHFAICQMCLADFIAATLETWPKVEVKNG